MDYILSIAAYVAIAAIVAVSLAPLVVILQLITIFKIRRFMSAIETLKAAVAGLQTTSAQGFAAQAAAFEELAADIAAIPASADIEAEAAKIAATATELGTFSTAFAQRLRDALPTEVEEPLPPVVEEPAPVVEEPVKDEVEG